MQILKLKSKSESNMIESIVPHTSMGTERMDSTEQDSATKGDVALSLHAIGV